MHAVHITWGAGWACMVEREREERDGLGPRKALRRPLSIGRRKKEGLEGKIE